MGLGERAHVADQVEAGVSIRWCSEPEHRGNILEGSFAEDSDELAQIEAFDESSTYRQ